MSTRCFNECSMFIFEKFRVNQVGKLTTKIDGNGDEFLAVDGGCDRFQQTKIW
ncbi:hypothetical protein HanXRQr2_Chr03g0096121 [Helianthus annuus]|uniref:Uncharacterized protein n=1 Tax=Helianthus annuus TaxID=4232 RepID=A0A251TY37_HELAN|nr:hypothetical protein HanXRQr2_Chr03g0096121 [Helianthus annuus]KAJ0942506.1 hypothetical protein HanPSC8_Chr03g0092721 [Helianthus annuus]